MSTSPGEPGWYGDPDAPATLERRWDGVAWTDETRPTGYVTQPGGPVAGGPAGPTFGAAPAPSGDPEGPPRRQRTAVVAAAVAALLVIVALLLVVTGVL